MLYGVSYRVLQGFRACCVWMCSLLWVSCVPVVCFCSLNSLPFIGNVSTWGVSVTAPGGCRYQGCHGFLHALLEAQISAPTSPRHLSQAHKLALNLFIASVHLKVLYSLKINRTVVIFRFRPMKMLLLRLSLFTFMLVILPLKQITWQK